MPIRKDVGHVGTTDASMSASAHPRPEAPACILVVDDEPDIRKLLRVTMETAGHKVLEACHGGEAASLVSGHPVDVVITDLVMPEREGIETILALNRENPEIKIIAMSGAFDGRFLPVAGTLGAHATIQKPFSVHRVLEIVAEMLR